MTEKEKGVLPQFMDALNEEIEESGNDEISLLFRLFSEQLNKQIDHHVNLHKSYLRHLNESLNQ